MRANARANIASGPTMNRGAPRELQVPPVTGHREKTCGSRGKSQVTGRNAIKNAHFLSGPLPEKPTLGCSQNGRNVATMATFFIRGVHVLILFNSRNVRGWRAGVANGRFTLEVLHNLSLCATPAQHGKH